MMLTRRRVENAPGRCGAVTTTSVATPAAAAAVQQAPTGTLAYDKWTRGAEEVLARLIWELEVSKISTPLALGEMIQARSYDACGRVNRRAHGSRDKDILQLVKSDSGVQLVEKTKTLDPRREEMVGDAFNANKWAYVFAGNLAGYEGKG